MKMRKGKVAAAIFALACMSLAQAHHSISMFDISTPVWLKGTVVSYEARAPHAMIALDVRNDDGDVQQWVVEGPWPGRLNRILAVNGLSSAEGFFQAGDTIEVCGFFLKQQWAPERMYAESGWSSSRFVHGQMIVMPDGHLQSWGPYGKMENCVRPKDGSGPWIEFLNADPLARSIWCEGLSTYSKQFALVPSEAFVNEVSRLIDDPCA